MNVDGWLPEDLKSRGVADVTKLPLYHHRDDGILLHNAIFKYVTQVLKNIYDTQEKLLEDYEIQDWAECLTNTQCSGGIKGVFGGGKFEDLDDLIKTVTSIIYIASVGHASANFSQYDSYGFPPAAPLYLNGSPPTDKKEISEKDILSYLPDKDKTLETMVTTHLLSDRGTNKLGDFEIQYLYEPKTLEALESFQKELLTIGKTINERNWLRQYPYTYLDPENVPNSISI